MGVVIDIFNPQVTAVAKGFDGKAFMFYGGNNLGKTYVATHMSKPFVIACESGLNALSGVKYNRVNSWADMKKLVKQFTSKATVDKAREMYDTIIIDEVYASSIYCQDYIMATHGNGALTLGDSDDPRKNLYKLYETEYFRVINQLLSCDYTVVFIAHAQEKDGYVTPKGDKRCLNPIIDNCDFVVYLTSNGVDENGKVQLSTAHFAETDKFFARSRFTECVTSVTPFTVENLEKVVIDAIEAEEKLSGVTAITYAEQKAKNTSVSYDYDTVMDELQVEGQKFAKAGLMDTLTEIVEDTLGPGKRVSECTKKQIDAMVIILDNLRDKAAELGLK